jgi:glycine dehydrogenase
VTALHLPSSLLPSDDFAPRHLGPRDADVAAMLAALGLDSLEALADATVPADIRLRRPLELGPPVTEHRLLEELRTLAGDNQVLRSFLGQGYYDTITPPVILRNILENPGWYTAYTPYQAEISQGRLEALINFQTMIGDLTGLPLANASLLDEATAAAEAMNMCVEAHERKRKVFVVDAGAHPQTIAVVETRAQPLGVEIRVVASERLADALGPEVAGVLISYPTTDGALHDPRAITAAAATAGVKVVMATDLLALTLLHAARRARRRHRRSGRASGSACRWASAVRTRPSSPRPTRSAASCPGRIIGVSRDRQGQAGLPPVAPDPRAAHPPREGDLQHLHRPGAAGGDGRDVRGLSRPRGAARDRDQRVHALTATCSPPACPPRLRSGPRPFFDTLRVRIHEDADRHPRMMAAAAEAASTCAAIDDGVGMALRRDHRRRRWWQLLEAFAGDRRRAVRASGAELLPDPRGLQPLPRRARDAALPASPGDQGPVAHDLDDPARLLHHEAQRHLRDDPGDLARVRAAAPLRAGRPGRGLPARCSIELETWLAEITGFAATVAAAQRRLPGRVRRPAGHPRPTTRPGAKGTATSA